MGVFYIQESIKYNIIAFHVNVEEWDFIILLFSLSSYQNFRFVISLLLLNIKMSSTYGINL